MSQNTQDAHDTHRFLPSNYVGSTEHLYTWNDMNEPSVFNGPEASTVPPPPNISAHVCVSDMNEPSVFNGPEASTPPQHTRACRRRALRL